MTTFTINGKEYKAKEMDFNFMCLLDDEGVSLDEIDTKTIKFLRAYFSYCSGLKSETAGQELNMHMINGGNLDGLSTAMFEAGEKSAFLQALTNRASAKKPSGKKAKTPETE